uniref:TTC3/DZIP3-like helical domain-containing protein n=1 Tax=Parascaris univalens TaxID=6257 RepID=A0A914ZZE2_PARUN
MASVKPSDADVAVVVKHLEQSFKCTPFDQSLRKLSSIARGESTVEHAEGGQQGSGSPTSSAEMESFGDATDEREQPFRLFEGLDLAKNDAHHLERLLGLFLGDKIFVANDRIERLADDAERIALLVAALDASNEVLSEELRAANRSLRKIQKKQSLVVKQYEEQVKEKARLSECLKKVQDDLAEEKMTAENLKKQLEGPCELESETRFLVKKLEEVQLKCTEEIPQLRSELQSSKERLKKMIQESKDRKMQLTSVTNDVRECERERSVVERKLAEEDEACKERLALVEDRLKNAEMETLKLQQKRCHASLERAYEDAAQYVRELEAALKRMDGVMDTEEQLKALFYWKARCEYISELIATSVVEYDAQIKEISAGKRLDELPQICLPITPPVPKLFESKQIVMTAPSFDGMQRPTSTTRYGDEFFEAQSREHRQFHPGSSSAVSLWKNPQETEPNSHISVVSSASSGQISQQCCGTGGEKTQSASNMPNIFYHEGHENILPTAGYW